MQCPRCQTESTGTYCPECGAPLASASCAGCQKELLAGARFCTSCGRAVRETASNLPWYLAGAAIVAALVVVLLPGFRAPGPEMGPGSAPPAVPAPGQTAQGPAPPLTGTPREQADRLFNRVMGAEADGNTAEAQFFLPMALEAYRLVGDLDADGRYHLSVLLAAAGDYRQARTLAEQVLIAEPQHLLALGSAARAARATGDTDVAREYYDRLLSAYEAGVADPLPEYLHHERILPEYRDEAREFLGR